MLYFLVGQNIILRLKTPKELLEVENLKKIISQALVFLLVMTAFTLVPVLSSSVDSVSAATPWVEPTPAPTPTRLVRRPDGKLGMGGPDQSRHVVGRERSSLRPGPGGADH